MLTCTIAGVKDWIKAPKVAPKTEQGIITVSSLKLTRDVMPFGWGLNMMERKLEMAVPATMAYDRPVP